MGGLFYRRGGPYHQPINSMRPTTAAAIPIWRTEYQSNGPSMGASIRTISRALGRRWAYAPRQALSR